MKMKNLSYLLVVLSLLFVGCNDDDNDDDANLHIICPIRKA